MPTISTARFGTIDIPDEAIYTFPAGIPGFPDEKRFAVLKNGLDNTQFSWLQSIQDGNLSFLTIDPNTAFVYYTVSLSDDDAVALQAEWPQQLQLLCIVTVPEGGLKQATANLKAPIVLNLATMLAAQVVLDNANYSIRQPLFGEGA